MDDAYTITNKLDKLGYCQSFLFMSGNKFSDYLVSLNPVIMESSLRIPYLSVSFFPDQLQI